LDRSIQHVRYVLRKLARTPVFTLTAVGTLALGIGANSAIFTVVNGILLKPLPFERPAELVGVWHTAPGLGFDQVNQSPAMYLTYREEGRVFQDIALWDNRTASITGLEEPEQVRTMMVTDGFFPLLEVTPAVGRIFSPQDDAPDAPLTAMLSHGYWQRALGGDPSVVGRSLEVNGRSREIIGVLSEDFSFLRYEPAVWVPAQFDPAELSVGNFDYQGIARLKPGVTLAQANADVERLIPRSVEKFPGGITLPMLQDARMASDVHPLKDDVVGDVGRYLWVLLGTVAIVLLIACANVANLFLVRSEGRTREMAVRTAMGAGRARVTGELLMESLVLGLLGGLAGLALAYGGIRILVGIAPENLPRLSEITLDPVVLLYTVGLSVFAGLVFGLFPILRYGRLNLVSALKEGGRGSSSGKERHRARNGLVVVQVALALVLLVGSGLMIRSFQALRSVHPGFERPEEVLTFRVSLPRPAVPEQSEAIRVHQTILDRLAALPGVTSAGASFSVTMDGWDSNDAVWVEDFPTPEGQIPPIRRFKWVAGDYFQTMENPLLAGRSIEWPDIYERNAVVVVTENFAREYWASPAAALGRRISTGDPADPAWREIVGVVGNVQDDGLDREATSVVYWPLAVDDFWGDSTFVQRSMAYALRTRGTAPLSLLPQARQAVWSVNPNLPLAGIRSLDEILADSMARTSFTMVLLAIAAVVALILGSVGIYGVISYVVSQRTREIGVRIALGAQRADVSRLVLRQGLILAVSGVGLGLVAALGLTRLMSSLLFGVAAADPVTYGAVALTLTGVALLASYLPAARAAGVDPNEALRWE
jgi:predicted permease